MNLYDKWEELAGQERSKEEYDQFWEEYFTGEQKNYEYILENKLDSLSGKLGELAEKFNMDAVTFAGFIYGINTSLEEEVNLKDLAEDTQLNMKIDFEKLYFNMLEAKAEWLYTLPQWDNILSIERRKEIKKDFNRSKIVVRDAKTGRNDPCPCGSGKKYKKCCGN